MIFPVFHIFTGFFKVIKYLNNSNAIFSTYITKVFKFSSIK